MGILGESWVGRRLSDIDRFAFQAYRMDNLLGDYGIMGASEQEQGFYMSVKALQSIVGDEGLGREPGTASVDGRAFRVYIRLTAVGTSGRGYLEEVG